MNGHPEQTALVAESANDRYLRRKIYEVGRRPRTRLKQTDQSGLLNDECLFAGAGTVITIEDWTIQSAHEWLQTYRIRSGHALGKSATNKKRGRKNKCREVTKYDHFSPKFEKVTRRYPGASQNKKPEW
jgi:hypothetical protein